MSRRPLVKLLILFSLAAAAPAEPGRQLEINLPWASQLRYRADRPGTAWVSLPGGRAGRNLVEVPQENLVLEAQRAGEWLTSTRASEKVLATQARVDPRFERGPNWLHISGLAGLLGLAAFGLYRRRQQRRWEAAQQLEPLIRSDGKVPRRRVGSYRLTKVLGSGGMGVVYRGESDDGFAVAVKVPSPHLIRDADFRQRFFREIELGLKLQHPRVVRVLELPLQEELYVVMEYVEGQPLDQVPVQPWPIEVKRCLVWAEQALEALAYIHAQGVIHRDLKPSNLMILADHTLKLMDFGIAHKVHGTRLTGTDHILGTPLYMTPEQLQGAAADPRSDLYSLGVILYERLRPGLPYPEEMMDLLRHKLSQPLPALADSNPSISPELDAFMNGLIAHSPEDRFAGAAEALQEVRRLGRRG